MASPDTLDSTATFRVAKTAYVKFCVHCKDVLGREPSDVLREVTSALSDGRVTISETDEQITARKSLYNS